MSNEIKPCPFCGSTDVDAGDSALAEWATCNNCQAAGPPSNSGDHYDRWNERSDATEKLRMYALGYAEAISDALLKIPGGQSCDAQAVADAIRELLRKP